MYTGAKWKKKKKKDGGGYEEWGEKKGRYKIECPEATGYTEIGEQIRDSGKNESEVNETEDRAE